MMDPNKRKSSKVISEEKLLRVAENNVRKRISQSPILANQAVEESVPQFALNELEIGRVLGRGAFSLVCDIEKFKVPKSEGPVNAPVDKNHCDSHFQDRKFMASNCLRDGKDCRYAVKSLQDSMRRDPDLFVRSLVDIVVETRFLATVHHPNIIKMRAVANTSPYAPHTCYFVVMDKLYEMLSTRLNTTWKYRVHSKMAKMMDLGNKQKKKCWIERLSVSYDVASALSFLHKMNIVYRDLKTDNIGFDVNGNVKMFDFGLARELQPSIRDKDGTYKMTGDVGSLRYMAPEVALEKPYNETCDVYSFSILLWQILKVEIPFDLYDRPASFQSKVVRKGVRPRPDPKWPMPLVDAMKKGWDVDIKQRPSMKEMGQVIDKIILKETGEARSATEDHSKMSVKNMSHQSTSLTEKSDARTASPVKLAPVSDDKTEETAAM